MISQIKLTKYAAIVFITLSVVSIIGYVAQKIGDQTKLDLKSYTTNKDRLIDDLTTELLKAHENNVINEETELGTFLESLDLKSKQNSIISLQEEINLLESRVADERSFIEYVSIFLIVTASSIFILLILVVKRRNKKKNEWINSLAHQLQNSVAPISVGISNLKLDLSEEDRNESLNILYKEAGRLNLLTEKMLQLFSYKQIRRKNIKENEEELNLESIINKIINDPKLLSNKKNLSLSCSSKIEKPLVLGDKTLIEQLFINLINNAMGFSYPKDEIFIEISNIGKSIIVKVIDQGIGIKDKKKILIDGAVYPTQKIDESKGHGLGLKLVRRIVILHDGKFDINNNKDGKGVTATVKFPS